MSNATAKLKYKNEDDRCYGLAGMAIKAEAAAAFRYIRADAGILRAKIERD